MPQGPAQGAAKPSRPFPEAPKPLFKPTIEVSAMATNPFLWLIRELLWIYIYIVIASVVFSWLIVFNVVNTRNQVVNSIGRFLYVATEPVLGRIRAFMPNLGGLDLSPMILILGLIFLDRLIVWLYIQLFL
jgi:YggT family protein